VVRRCSCTYQKKKKKEGAAVPRNFGVQVGDDNLKFPSVVLDDFLDL
jgi:hypothetical protein